MSSKLQITWRGPIFDTSGYAKVGREMCLALAENEVDVRIEPLNHNAPVATINATKLSMLQELCKVPLSSGHRVLLYHMQPHTANVELERKTFHKVTCLTYCETFDVLPSWRNKMAQFDAMFAGSTQNAAAFNIVKVPVILIPHGADFNWVKRTSIPPVNLPHDTFKFLCVAAWQHRKGPEVLFKAFWEAFGPDDKVDLICKFDMGSATRSEHVRMRERIRDIKPKDKGVRPIRVCTDRLSEVEIEALYRFSNAFVLPTRGEGLCLPLFEATKWKLPVIATAWGGHTDVFGPETSLPINYRLESCTGRSSSAIAPLFPEIFTSNMNWAEPDNESLVRQMRFIVDQRNDMQPMIKRAMAACEGSTWPLAVNKLIDSLNSL